MILFVILFFFFSGFTFRSMTHFFELIFVYGARCDQLLLRFYLHRGIHVFWASQETQVAKNPPANAGDGGLIPGSGRSPGGGHGSPLQYPCLENTMYRGAWWAKAHAVAKSRTWLKHLSTRSMSNSLPYLQEHIWEKETNEVILSVSLRNEFPINFNFLCLIFCLNW